MTEKTSAARPAGAPAVGWSLDWCRLDKLFPAGLVLLLVMLTVVPLLFLVVGSFRPTGFATDSGWTLDHYIGVWGNPYTYVLVRNTLVFTVGSTAIAILIALPLSWILERTNIPVANFYKSAMVIPMVLPPLLLAMGWVLIMSPRIGMIPSAFEQLFGFVPDWMDIYTVAGLTFVQGLAYVPTALLVFSPVVRNMDSAFEEASRMSGATGLQTIRHISLPFLFPSILSTATLCFMVGMLAFDIPAVIGMAARIDLMSIQVFRQLNPESGSPNYGAAAATNSVLMIALFLFLIFYARMLKNSKRYVTISGKAFKAKRYELGRWRFLATGFVIGYFVVGIVLPFLAMFWVSLLPYLSGFDPSLFDRLSFAAYGTVLNNARFWRVLSNASLVALVASLGSLALALAVARVTLKGRGVMARLVGPLAMLPLGIPHLMMGIALVFVLLNMRFIPLYGTLWIIAIGHIISYLAVTSRMMQLGMMQLGSELEEVAMISGASPFQRLRDIVVPLLQPTFIAIFIWMFSHSVREFSLAMMLQSGRNEVLSTLLFNYWNTSSPSIAAAMAVIVMVSLFFLAAIIGFFFRSKVEV